MVFFSLWKIQCKKINKFQINTASKVLGLKGWTL